MIRLFRIVAILEGISFLMLFAFGMPLKYWAQIPKPNIYIGYAHGFLFMAYVVLVILLYKERSWSFRKFAVYFTASLLPFGTFYVVQNYLTADNK